MEFTTDQIDILLKATANYGLFLNELFEDNDEGTDIAEVERNLKCLPAIDKILSKGSD